ncbi:MAG: hypothetical protein AUJ92_03045 [Armatimonadetes bacterium CG2_30_59_28]|nr:hypothetical protein [Armatimonadota bacterium]OIO97702.1 MAG: hypothetical protein AUJ92_03045 [Armatimonadetes bacterium CG2_30_59_28]PIU60662.1 MAG: hypothetical protein COS85_23345 [Armatimonadetes bacterium CG07_land_8_20_14_0_80_59_28]
MRRFPLLASLTILHLAALPCAHTLADGTDTDGDGITDEVEQQLFTPVDVKPELLPVATSKNENYTEEQAKVNAPDLLSLEACHVGARRLLFKVTFARRPNFGNATFIVYADLDNNQDTGRQDNLSVRGADVMVVASNNQMSVSRHNPSFNSGNTTIAGAALVGNVLYITLDAAIPESGDNIPVALQLLSQREGGKGDYTPRQVVELPRFADRQVPKVTRKGAPDLKPLSDYRFHNDLVKYEKLEDKGLTYEAVKPAKPFEPGRPQPAPLFASTARQPGKAGSVKRREVRVELLEESGIARRGTPITFGFPLPKGAVFNLSNLRSVSPTGAELSAQFTATSFWPDDSLKWVLVDFTTPLNAKEKRECVVQFGSDVKRTQASTPLKITDTPSLMTIVTGPLRVELDKQHFNLLRGIWMDKNRDGKFDQSEQQASSSTDGIRLVDEKGKVFTSSAQPPDSVKVEEQGSQKVVVRVEGKYAAADGETCMRYVARLTFRAGWPRVTVALTHINDYLKTEFTDITSLSLPFQSSGQAQPTSVYLPGESGSLNAVAGQRLSFFQSDERTCTVQADDRKSTGGQAPGVLRCVTSNGVMSAGVQDFWQRWPKGFTAQGNQYSVDLLPPQPNAQYGTDLPHYLLFCFVEGKYRFKWGMSFTERVTLDFAPETKAEELAADVSLPVVAVVPAAWYAETGAMGLLAAPREKQFAQWDKFVESSLRANVQRQKQEREYGYLNYGDWYGERGRNWGNNEYDRGHSFFMQFARTGNRDYFRLALSAARHEADVDCIHAYPDGFYVGGNHPHSIGHTGAWTETTAHGTWDCRFDGMSTAANGHNWADGMMDAWYLTGDARVMEAAIGLGEHVAWAMSPTFKALGTHERTAGWSLKTIMAIYRGTYDPVYLEAAKRITEVALREQKFDDGGAWPHILPEDHAGGHAGASGNNLFLIGVLLGGMTEYHEETHDPAVEKSLITGAQWVIKSWDENAEGWPYSASPTGQPYYRASTILNALIVEPLAYVGHLTGDERFIEIAETGLEALSRGGGDSFGKSIAQQMHFTSGTMALLQQWYDKHRSDKGVSVMDGSVSNMLKYFGKTPDADRHAVRAPDEKVFFLRMNGTTTELIATRTPHGAMTKRAELGTIRVLDSTGAVIREGKFSTDDKHEFRCPLQGNAGAQLKVVVNDDQRGVWSLKGENFQVVMQTLKEFRIGGVGRGRYHFFVPQGTKEFKVKLLGVHPGQYGAAGISPEGKVVGYHQDSNQGQALILGAQKVGVPNPNAHPEQGTLVIQPAPADTGKMWSLILWAAGDIGCELEGVPPYLALTEKDWFEPGK